MGCTQKFIFVLAQIFWEVYPQFSIFNSAVLTTSAYCDEDSHVVFVDLCLNSFIPDQIKRKSFSRVKNWSALITDSVVELRAVARMIIFGGLWGRCKTFFTGERAL